MTQTAVGMVYLVGAGPGHPGLMTVRAVEVLKAADVVVYDRLLSPRALGLAPMTAEFVYVGKESGKHTVKQSEINSLLVSLAQAGKSVVRLKGGDPFVFGRGGEEAETCHEAGVPFEVVPGVTSAVAVSAYAGIPVTHRGVATSFTVLTGHQCAAGTDEDVDWTALGAGTGTLVILMGVSQLETIVRRLRSAGRLGDTPAALIRWGTRAAQETLQGTLDTIARQARDAGFASPAVIVVGNVVRQRQALSWFEDKPLMGKRILVAADTKDLGQLVAEALEDLGAETLDISVEQGTAINPLVVQQILHDVAQRHCSEAGLLFQRVQAVHAFFASMTSLGMDWRVLSRFQFGSVNGAVTAALAEHNIQADFTAAGIATGTDGDIALVECDPPYALCSQDSVSENRLYHIVQQPGTTPQLEAMWSAVDMPFDLCVATSKEALGFVQQLQGKLGGVPIGTASTPQALGDSESQFVPVIFSRSPHDAVAQLVKSSEGKGGHTEILDRANAT